MLETLKQSTEPNDDKALAKSKIAGILGDLNQRRRKAKEVSEQKHNVSQPHQIVNAGPYLNGHRQGKENNGLDRMAHLFHSSPYQG